MLARGRLRRFCAQAPTPATLSGPETLAGVHRGYAIVCSAYPVNEGFAGRAAIYATRPQPGVAPLEQVGSGDTYESAQRAMLAAARRARQVIDGLTPNWTPFTQPT